MFSLLSSSTIGVEFTGTALQIVSARRRGEKVQVQAQKRVMLPEGTAAAEIIAKELGPLLAAAKTKDVMLCIPPSKMYTALFRLPSSPAKQRGELLEREIAASIPEALVDITVLSRVLRQSKEDVDIGVAAVRKDVLQGYVRLLEGVPCTVRGITTTPCLLAGVARTPGDGGSFLLIQTLTGGAAEHTLTLFHEGWPVDEAVLAEEQKTTDTVDAVKDFLAEYRRQGKAPIERLVVHGSAALLRSLEDAELALPVEEALPWLKPAEREWAGAILASTVSPEDLAVNFLP